MWLFRSVPRVCPIHTLQHVSAVCVSTARLPTLHWWGPGINQNVPHEQEEALPGGAATLVSGINAHDSGFMLECGSVNLSMPSQEVAEGRGSGSTHRDVRGLVRICTVCRQGIRRRPCPGGR